MYAIAGILPLHGRMQMNLENTLMEKHTYRGQRRQLATPLRASADWSFLHGEKVHVTIEIRYLLFHSWGVPYLISLPSYELGLLPPVSSTHSSFSTSPGFFPFPNGVVCHLAPFFLLFSWYFVGIITLMLRLMLM